MYGYKMRVETDKFTLVLRPYLDGEEKFMVEGMQSLQVRRYLGRHGAETLETEATWIKGLAANELVTYWAITLLEVDGSECPIGTTSLGKQQVGAITASSGIVIYDRVQWRTGIATAAHLARTLYAFDIMDLIAVFSSFDQENAASRRALERVGYRYTGTDFYRTSGLGKPVITNSVMMVNPEEASWNYFWKGTSHIEDKFLDGREATKIALERARTCVTFI